MKVPHLRAVSAAVSALLILAASGADAQRIPAGGFRSAPPSHHGMHGFKGGFFPFFPYEREVVYVVEREVVRDDPPAEKPAAVEPPAPPRKPFVIGRSYSSLPGGCMKLIDEGVSYYNCSGEWYRQVGAGRGAQYKAVAQP